MERLGKRTVIMKEFVPAFIVNRIQQGISKAVWEMLEKGIYDYAGRSEAEILKKRDRRYLNLLDYLEKIKAFERV
jgi:hypothetical protein